MKVDMRKKFAFYVIIGLMVIIMIVQIISSFFITSQMNKSVSDLKDKAKEINLLVDQLNQNLQYLKESNKKIDELEIKIINLGNNLSQLSEKYPPQQTIYVEGMSQENLTNAINNYVDLRFDDYSKKITFNFWFNIIFGSLLSLGGISYYLIYRRGKK